MQPRDGGEVSGRPSGPPSSRQTRDAILSLNEAWLHTLDEYVIDTPLSQVILPVMRACFSAERLTRFCWRKGVMAIRSLPISLASSPNSRGRDPQNPDARGILPADEVNRQERMHQKEWCGRLKLRTDCGECRWRNRLASIEPSRGSGRLRHSPHRQCTPLRRSWL